LNKGRWGNLKVCEFSKYLSDYLENQLDEKKKLILKKHILTCSSCENELGELQLIREFFANLPEEDMSPFLHRRIMTKVRQQTRYIHMRKKIWFQRIAVCLSILALVFLLGRSFSDINVNTCKYMHEIQDEKENLIITSPSENTILSAEETVSSDSAAGRNTGNEVRMKNIFLLMLYGCPVLLFFIFYFLVKMVKSKVK